MGESERCRMTSKLRIRHPGWVIDAARSLSRTAYLLEAGRIPKSIEIQPIVVPVRRLLRGVYGGNAKAVWYLFWWAVSSGMSDLWHMHLVPFWHLTVLGKT